ncbi:hypothetical protein L6452_41983 [Arctium lappa]|uniref:Uncharacterized protein n=1 Tax=Arctium lappa TaxID=4217 RepID=A0ACB8XH80_ARCLA|nr:hypothetical protein L6452_41983 [Arctium lappa]
MTTSQDATPTNCFSSVFRRLLCAGGLPTHPSTDTTDNPNHQPTHLLFKTDSSFKLQSPSPTTIPAGVVARLMGIDSFPTTTPSTKVSLGTIMRSRSAGSVDFLPNFEIKKQPPHYHSFQHHRRVRTSVSFRELPTFLETSHNHDHGKLDDHIKSEMGFTPKQEKSKNLKKGTGREQEREKKMTNKKVEVLNRRKRRENGGKKKVVDDDGFHKYKSRKRTYNHTLPKMVKHDRKAKKQLMMLKRRESEYSEEYCMKVLVNVCRLTMEEINGGVWVDAKVDNNLQEISYEVGQEILQLLLYEMVDELCSSW